MLSLCGAPGLCIRVSSVRDIRGEKMKSSYDEWLQWDTVWQLREIHRRLQVHRDTGRRQCDAVLKDIFSFILNSCFSSSYSEQLDKFIAVTYPAVVCLLDTPFSSFHTLYICTTPHLVDSLIQMLVKTNHTSCFPLFCFVASSCPCRMVVLHLLTWRRTITVLHYRINVWISTGVELHNYSTVQS